MKLTLWNIITKDFKISLFGMHNKEITSTEKDKMISQQQKWTPEKNNILKVLSENNY